MTPAPSGSSRRPVASEPHVSGGPADRVAERAAPPRSLAVVAAVVAGMVVPVQARLNGELSHLLADGIAAAAISFSAGLVLLSVLALLFPGLRYALGTLRTAVRDGRIPRRYLLAGVLGATFALAQATTTLVTGIAVFTVCAITGQTLGGLIVDARGIGGGIRQRPNGYRLAGAGVILVAAVVAVLPQLAGAPEPTTVLLPALGALAAGFLLGPQQAMNGATTTASGSALAATWINFCVGAGVLGLAWGVKVLVHGPVGQPPPTEWWVYLGGLCGVVFIGASAFLVRRIGVLLLAMAAIAGQLTSSIALDLLVPSGNNNPSAFTVTGAVLTFVAVWIASRRPRGPEPSGEVAHGERHRPRR